MKYRAGTAKLCITPEEPLWLAGFAARTAPARGKLSDLFAAALALEDETGQRFVIATIDAIAVTRSISDAVADAVGKRHHLARRQLLLAATHTHYAPEFRTEKQVFFGIPREYEPTLCAAQESLVSALVRVIDRALTNLEPVRMLARRASVDFAHNRRRHGVRDGNPSSEDVVDHDIPVLDCLAETGQRKAIVFGYACHNTTIPPDDLRYCGDWSSFAKEILEQRHPGATALFIPGAAADQDPEPSGSVELSRQYGRQLADAVQRALDGPAVEIASCIGAVMTDVVLPLEPISRERIEAMLSSDDGPKRVKAQFLVDKLNCGEELDASWAVPIHVVRFGNEVLMIALGGEPVVDWSHSLKREFEESDQPSAGSNFPLVWVAGYCNDLVGYLPTRRVQAEGGYEGGRAVLWSAVPAPFTGELEERIRESIRRLLESIRD